MKLGVANSPKIKQPLLEVRQLSVAIQLDNRTVRAVDQISFQLDRGETLGIVGESGCGKSLTALALLRLLPDPKVFIDGGEILFNGENILNFNVQQLYQLRGGKVGMIFQEPMSALNPVLRVGEQIAEVLRVHGRDNVSKTDIIERIAEVGIEAPEKKVDHYPHQLSGGMRQRIMIAMAIACKPQLLIADEPTTALDVTTQAQILDLVKSLQLKYEMGLILITHDLGVVHQQCNRIAVMYAGQIVEVAEAAPFFARPLHPYAKGLMASLPLYSHTPKTPLPIIRGQVPMLDTMPAGCRFFKRCSEALPSCETTPQTLQSIAARKVACLPTYTRETAK